MSHLQSTSMSIGKQEGRRGWIVEGNEAEVKLGNLGKWGILDPRCSYLIISDVSL